MWGGGGCKPVSRLGGLYLHAYLASQHPPTKHHTPKRQNEPLFVRSLFSEEMGDATVLLRVRYRSIIYIIYIYI